MMGAMICGEWVGPHFMDPMMAGTQPFAMVRWDATDGLWEVVAGQGLHLYRRFRARASAVDFARLLRGDA
jgi:hypothetical protein